jgi:hypothetical protein
LLDLVAEMEKIPLREVALKLQEWFLGGGKRESTRAEPSGSKVSVSFQLRADLEH